jgi:hypothetical protein
MDIAKWLDFMLLVIFLAIGFSMSTLLLRSLGTSLVSYPEDKTALDTNNAIYVSETQKTGVDLLMSLVVTDDLNAFPRSFRIANTPIIDLNNDWVIEKSTNIAVIYSPGGSYKLGNMLNRKIKRTEYVQNGDDPYIRYWFE